MPISKIYPSPYEHKHNTNNMTCSVNLDQILNEMNSTKNAQVNPKGIEESIKNFIPVNGVNDKSDSDGPKRNLENIKEDADNKSCDPILKPPSSPGRVNTSPRKIKFLEPKKGRINQDVSFPKPNPYESANIEVAEAISAKVMKIRKPKNELERSSSFGGENSAHKLMDQMDHLKDQMKILDARFAGLQVTMQGLKRNHTATEARVQLLECFAGVHDDSDSKKDCESNASESYKLKKAGKKINLCARRNSTNSISQQNLLWMKNNPKNTDIDLKSYENVSFYSFLNLFRKTKYDL